MSNTIIKGQYNIVDENGDVKTIHPETTGDQVLVDRSSNASVIPNDVANLQHIINKMGSLALKSKITASDFDNDIITTDMNVTSSGKIADARTIKNLNDRIVNIENGGFPTLDSTATEYKKLSLECYDSGRFMFELIHGPSDSINDCKVIQYTDSNKYKIRCVQYTLPQSLYGNTINDNNVNVYAYIRMYINSYFSENNDIRVNIKKSGDISEILSSMINNNTVKCYIRNDDRKMELYDIERYDNETVSIELNEDSEYYYYEFNTKNIMQSIGNINYLSLIIMFGYFPITDRSITYSGDIDIEIYSRRKTYQLTYNADNILLDYYTREDADNILLDYYTREDIDSNYFTKKQSGMLTDFSYFYPGSYTSYQPISSNVETSQTGLINLNTYSDPSSNSSSLVGCGIIKNVYDTQLSKLEYTFSDMSIYSDGKRIKLVIENNSPTYDIDISKISYFTFTSQNQWEEHNILNSAFTLLSLNTKYIVFSIGTVTDQIKIRIYFNNTEKCYFNISFVDMGADNYYTKTETLNLSTLNNYYNKTQVDTKIKTSTSAIGYESISEASGKSGWTIASNHATGINSNIARMTLVNSGDYTKYKVIYGGSGFTTTIPSGSIPTESTIITHYCYKMFNITNFLKSNHYFRIDLLDMNHDITIKKC